MSFEGQASGRGYFMRMFFYWRQGSDVEKNLLQSHVISVMIEIEAVRLSPHYRRLNSLWDGHLLATAE